MNLQYVERALCFHGAPMQKIWDNERGTEDLQRLGIPLQPNYDVYQQRQRFFTFQDRAKRLKLHQFLARKATDLYDNELKKYANVPDPKHLEKVKTSFTNMPPYEVYACDPSQDKNFRWHTVLESLKPGDIIYAYFKTTPAAGTFPVKPLTVKPLCTAEPLVRYLNHLPLKCIIMGQDVGKPPLDKNGKIRGYLAGDIVRCEVLRDSIKKDCIYLGLNGVYSTELGLVQREDLPLYYNNAIQWASSTYEQSLKHSKEFLNPNYEVLYSINGLNINDTFSMMGALKLPFPHHEMATELRKAQAHKWAFRSVAEGIELFKNGQHLEAFQCLNKALSIDPYNVEGLVARGALFANRGSFHKAVDDFANALKLDKYHANARKYMGETLVALGRSLEEEKRYDDAAKAYKDCLELIPHHVQAMGCLEALNQRLTGSLLDDAFFDNLLNIPASTLGVKNAQQLNVAGAKPSNSSSSEDSSSDSDTSDSEEISTVAASTKLQKASSLSPLSKRLALHAASMGGFDRPNVGSINEAPPPPTIPPIPFDQPFFATKTNVPNADEFKLDDDDTQIRVLKLIEQASAHKKDKKKKTKKSKSKKAKKESKKRKKEHEQVSSDVQQSLFQSNYLLETFKNIGNDNFENKISKDINSYEHKIAEIRKRQEMLRESMTTGKSTVAGNTADLYEYPPPPPSMSLMAQTNKIHISLSKGSNKAVKSTMDHMTTTTSSSLISSTANDANRLSFQIKKPVKIDKFGLLRIATPLKQRSPSLTRDTDKSRSRSQNHSPDRSRSRYRHSSRSRSRSRSRRSRSSSYRRRRRRSNSHSKSRSKSYYRSKRGSQDSRSRRRDSRSRRRDSRSPYVRRRSRSKNWKHSERSPVVSHATRSPTFKSKVNHFGNRVWQRPGYAPPPKSGVKEPKASDKRWKHDKFEEINNDQPSSSSAKEDGPSIEEIDEIINKAQKERKAEIIKRDKDILKKPNNGRF